VKCGKNKNVEIASLERLQFFLDKKLLEENTLI